MCDLYLLYIHTYFRSLHRNLGVSFLVYILGTTDVRICVQDGSEVAAGTRHYYNGPPPVNNDDSPLPLRFSFVIIHSLFY